MLRGVLLLFICLFCHSTFGQKTQDTRAWEAGSNFGFLIAHRPEIQNLQVNHARGINVRRYWQTSGRLLWHQNYLMPKVGLELQYFDLGNSRELGFQVAANTFIHLPLGRNSPFYQQVGFGVGYGSKKWDLEENGKNLMLGSHINGSMFLATGVDFRISKGFLLSTGIKLSHLSNAAFTLPNLGTNVASVFASVKYSKGYRFNNPMFDNGGNIKDPIGRSRHQFVALITAGARSVNIGDSRKFPAGGLSIFYKQRATEKTFWLLGGDILYNPGSAERLAKFENGQRVGAGDPLRAGIKAGAGMILDALSLHVEMGAYVYDPIEIDDMWYNRLQLSYHWGPAFYSTVGLKTHFARADHIEFGLGYRIFTSNAQI